VRCSSNMKPRFRAEWVVVSEELLILASCLLRPMSRNSVLEELRVRRFAVIQEDGIPIIISMTLFSLYNLSYVMILA